MLEVHKEFHTLIQRHADNALHVDEQALMREHIKSCPSCKKYAEELLNLEGVVRQSMSRRWTMPHSPVSIEHILKESRRKADKPTYSLAVRLATVSALVVTLSLFLLQSTLTSTELPVKQAPVIIPTPSLTATNPVTSTSACPDARYTTQAGDTLSSVAMMFTISEEEIRKANNLQGDGFRPGTNLTIPTCKSTPTSTTSPAAAGFTITPLLDVTTVTPDS